MLGEVNDAAHGVKETHEYMALDSAEQHGYIEEYAGRIGMLVGKIVEFQERIQGLSTLNLLSQIAQVREFIDQAADVSVEHALKLQGATSKHAQKLIDNTALASEVNNTLQQELSPSKLAVPPSVNAYLELAITELNSHITRIVETSETSKNKLEKIAKSSEEAYKAFMEAGGAA